MVWQKNGQEQPAPQGQEEIERTTTIDLSLNTRGTVVSELPQIGLVVKAADQGSLEAILDWIDGWNEKTKEAEELPEAAKKALHAVAKARVGAQVDKRRTVELQEAATGKEKGGIPSSRDSNDRRSEIEEKHEDGAENEEEEEDSLTRPLDEHERQLLMRWLPLCVVHSGVGPVNPSDVKHAALTNAFVFAFSVRALEGVEHKLSENKLILRKHNIIYRLFEDLETLCEYHFGSEYLYSMVGRLIVTRTASFNFKKGKGGTRTVVGVDVKEGNPSNQHFYSIERHGAVLAEKLVVKSMQRNRQDSSFFPKGTRDAAIIFDSPYADFQEKDMILAYERKERPPPPFITSRRYLQT